MASARVSCHQEERNGPYLENQDRLLCGKHAINHLLQEEKIVWKRVKKGLNPSGKYIQNDNRVDDDVSPCTPGVQLNIYRLCDDIQERLNRQIKNSIQSTRENDERRLQAAMNLGNNAAIAQALSRFNNQNDESIYNISRVETACSKTKDNITFEGVHCIIRDFLNYRTALVHPYKDAQSEFRESPMTELLDSLYNENFMGIIINTDGHYTSVVKNVSTCPKPYAYIDSMTEVDAPQMKSKKKIQKSVFVAEAHMECYNEDELLTKLFELPISAMIFVFNQPGAYKCVTVKNLHDHSSAAFAVSKNMARLNISHHSTHNKSHGGRRNRKTRRNSKN